VVILVATILVTLQPTILNTKKWLIRYALEQANPDEPLLFIEEVPFSARFYSRNEARPSTINDVYKLTADGQIVWLAIARHHPLNESEEFKGAEVYESKRHLLYQLSPLKRPLTKGWQMRRTALESCMNVVGV